ncbi:MAG: Replication-associated recombination protein A [bacterium ADurb.Bin374]|nr:MAG: Replication-associated recombination protein A [bacterium ADurb.Bin374]
MPDLFDIAPPQAGSAPFQPLADRVRPATLDQIRGQEHLLNPGKPIRMLLEAGKCPSMIFWGPPGCGKTTLARVIANLVDAEFIQLSAVTCGLKELREAFENARIQRTRYGRRTVLFIDEIHRFNKAQQDALLPHVESGATVLIGATTENPSFEVVSALLSRCQVLTLQSLPSADLRTLLNSALERDGHLMRPPKPTVESSAIDRIAEMSAGDARIALNVLETCCEVARQEMALAPHVDDRLVADVFQNKSLRYDKGGEEHYNLISALHKSMRGSDPDASLYWLYRMLDGGEDARFILRRMIRFASEDVGMADPFALTLAMSAAQAFDYIGPPEGHLTLAHLAVYLAAAPKSNALYMAEKRVRDEIHSGREPGVPLHIRNAPTRLMKELDYGKEYRYPHDYPGGFLHEEYFPDEVKERRYYEPKPIGREKSTADRLRQLWPERYGKPVPTVPPKKGTPEDER